MSTKSKHAARCSGCADLREQLKHAQDSADVRFEHERKQLADEAEQRRKHDAAQRERGEAKARWVMQGLAQGWLIVVERDGAYEFDLNRSVSDWTKWLPMLSAGLLGAWALARAKGKPASSGAQGASGADSDKQGM